MKEKLKIPFPIIVEGKYDRQKVLSVVDARVLTTDGFGIFNESERLTLFRRLSEKTQIIVLADSDGAGKLIRSHICSAIPKHRLIQLYTPRIEGKEKRKAEPSKEGILGVEGMDTELLYELFKPYTDESAVLSSEENPLSKTDFFADGLSGGPNSAALRDEFAKAIGLPPGMTANALLSAAKLLVSYDEYKKTMEKLKENSEA